MLDVTLRGVPSRASLLIFSDVHLGSDLNDAGPVTRRSSAIDRDLVRLLAHYRGEKPPSGRWSIVIAGDFIDFVGMAVDPAGDDERRLATPLNAEERAHGVGNAEDHARFKLARVARRHADVFAELGAFVAEGHSLTIVSGNHDIEFHWDGVQEDFRSLLLASLPSHARVAPCDVAAFRARVEFSPLFFYRSGVVYVEHGHQYDPFCSTAHPMSPLSPIDPRRIVRAFSDVLLRFVVRRTRGMKEHGHEHLGLVSYIRMALGLGFSGMFALGGRFVRSIAELFRIRREYLGRAARALEAEHERRVARLAERSQVGKERLAKLLSLHAKPIAHSIRGILASVLLDRLALALGALAILAVLASFKAPYAALGVVLATWAVAHVVLSRLRIVDPAAQLVERAGHLARLFPAAFVVMGHTHVPATTPAGDATYINLGSWAEGDGDYRAARTHLVIHERDGAVEARFCEWREGEGPRLCLPGPAAGG